MFGRTNVFMFFMFYVYLLIQKPSYLQNLIALALVLTDIAIVPLKGS